MKRPYSTEEEVEKTLNSADEWERRQAKPFFYTRLQARIDELDSYRPSVWELVFQRFLLRPAFILGVVLINLFSFWFITQNRQSTFSDRSEQIEAIAQELGMDNAYTIWSGKEL